MSQFILGLSCQVSFTSKHNSRRSDELHHDPTHCGKVAFNVNEFSLFYYVSHLQIASIIAIFMVVGMIANPVPAVETTDSETQHDLDTAEVLLEIIEKKISKLYKVEPKKCSNSELIFQSN